MNNDYLSSISNFDLFRLILEKFGIEVKDENDIAGAWRVIEKMEKGPVEIFITAGETRVNFIGYLGCKASAPTTPLAICRAALLGMEKE